MKQLRTPMFTMLDGSEVVLFMSTWYADTHKLFLAFGDHGMYCPVVFD
jgi:hypothetical protein